MVTVAVAFVEIKLNQIIFQSGGTLGQARISLQRYVWVLNT